MKRILPIVLIGIIAGLLVVIGLLLGGKKFRTGSPPLVTEKSQISAHTVIKDVLPIGEYASLAYHYTSVVKDVNARDIKGWTIPFTTRKYIFTYDGTMKLGIDGRRIQVEELPPPGSDKANNAETTSAGNVTVSDAEQPVLEAAAKETVLPVIRITLPPVHILSHEIMDSSIEVFEQSQTIFNQIKIEDAFKVTADRKREMEQRVMASSAVNEARVSVEQQLGALLRSLPGIRGAYEVIFVWEEPENPQS